MKENINEWKFALGILTAFIVLLIGVVYTGAQLLQLVIAYMN